MHTREGRPSLTHTHFSICLYILLYMGKYSSAHFPPRTWQGQHFLQNSIGILERHWVSDISCYISAEIFTNNRYRPVLRKAQANSKHTFVWSTLPYYKLASYFIFKACIFQIKCSFALNITTNLPPTLEQPPCFLIYLRPKSP